MVRKTQTLLPKDATDLLALQLPLTRKIQFPDQRNKLLLLLKLDQKQASNLPAKPDLADWPNQEKLYKKRSRELLEIMNIIKVPTVTKIGLDGSRAAWLISQHSDPDTMRLMLARFRRAYYRQPDSVFFQGIPFMSDALRVNQRRAQRYGTQYYVDATGSTRIFPVTNVERLDTWRRKYGLAPLNLTPNGRWPAAADFL